MKLHGKIIRQRLHIKKQSISAISLVLIIFVFILSCGPAKLNTKLTENNRYNLIWVGWLDLGEQNFKKLGYRSEVEWKDEIKQQNISLQGFIKNKMRGWNVTGANAKTDEPPKNPGTIVISFKNTVFDVQTTVAGVISTDADFIDAASKKVLVALDQRELGATITHSMTFSNMSLGGRLNNAMYNIAYDVHYYLTM